MKSVLTSEKVCFLKYQDKTMCSAFFSDSLLLPLPPQCPSWDKGRNIHINFSLLAQFFKVVIVLWFSYWLFIQCPLLHKTADVPCACKGIQDSFLCFCRCTLLTLMDKVLRSLLSADSCSCWSQCSPTAAYSFVCKIRQKPSALKETCDNNYESYTKLISDNME